MDNALQTTPAVDKPADNPAYHRMTANELQIMRSLRKAGKSQAYIAEQLGRGQSTISFWLNELEDTTELATEYLSAKAFSMAKNVVEHGQARDHIAALKGLKVLKEDGSSIKIAIGVSLPGMPVQSESLAITSVVEAGSDK